MGSSNIRPAARTTGSGPAAAAARRAGTTHRRGTTPQSVNHRPTRRYRRRDLRDAAWWTLAVTAALAINLAISLRAHAAGSPVPEDGQLRINTSRQAAADDKSFGAFGPQWEKFGIKPYLEYGLADRITMGLGSETQFVRSGLASDRAVRTDGFMNTEFFLRGRLREQDWYTISVQDILQLPGQDKARALTQDDSSLRLQYGRTGKIGNGIWTSVLKGGFHPSVNHVPDKLQTDLILGWRPAERWQFTAQSLNTVALDNGGIGGTVPSGIDSSKGQLSVTRNLSKSVSLQVGGWQTVSGGSGQPHGFDAIVWLRY
jgi:hypothetical protein